MTNCYFVVLLLTNMPCMASQCCSVVEAMDQETLLAVNFYSLNFSFVTIL